MGVGVKQLVAGVNVGFIDADYKLARASLAYHRDTVNEKRIGHRSRVGGDEHECVQICDRRTDEKVLPIVDLFDNALGALRHEAHLIADKRRGPVYPKLSSCPAFVGITAA